MRPAIWSTLFKAIVLLVGGFTHSSSANAETCAAQLKRTAVAMDNKTVLPLVHSEFPITMNGGGGRDTLRVGGPSDAFLTGKRLVSMEHIDMRNGQFDTFVLPQSFFASAGGNVEVSADLFDTVVLDPDIDWRTEKERDGIQFFRGQSQTIGELTFKAPPGTLILTRPERTIAPMPQQPAPAIGPQKPAPATASAAGAISIVRWEQSGWIAIPSKQVGPLGQKAFINMRNDSPNVMGLSLHAFRDVAHADIQFTADRSDRIVLAEPACWKPAEPSDADNVPLVTLEGMTPTVTVTGERPRARLRTDLEHTTFVATSENGGFHYLQTDVRRRIDMVDLANALPDILLVRPGNTLPTNRLVRVSGDNDGDRVWLHPSYAWRIEHGSDGLVARVQMGQHRWQGFVFARGVRVALLPRPAFLTASALAAVPFYPGLADKVARRNNLRMISVRAVMCGFQRTSNSIFVRLTCGMAPPMASLWIRATSLLAPALWSFPAIARKTMSSSGASRPQLNLMASCPHIAST